MEAFWLDVRLGLRNLKRSPGFAVVATLILAVGIATNTAIFSLVNAFFLRPLPFQEPGALVHVWQTDPERGSEGRVSVPNFLDWKRRSTVFHDLGGYFYGDVNIATTEEPVRVMGGRLTPNLIDLLGVDPLLGRGFAIDEDSPGKDRVALLSESFWRRRFEGDPNVPGRTIDIDGTPHTIVGVMPAAFVFPLKATQLWTPLSLDPWKDRRELHGPLMVVARMKPGITREKAQAEMNTIMSGLERDYPEVNRRRGANVVPLRESLLFFYDMIQLSFGVLFVAVGFILVMVCANVGNLLLARATKRTREIAIRGALGGSRGRLVRQLLTESAILAIVGGLSGAVLASLALHFMGPLLPDDLYRVGDLDVDVRALSFALGVSLFASLLFGLAPALTATGQNVALDLKEAGRGSTGSRSRSRLRSILVVSQVGIALLLLVGSALMVQSFLRLQTADAGFDAKRALTLEIVLPSGTYPGGREQNVFYEEAVRRVRALPGVSAATSVYPLPLNFESMSIELAVPGSTSDEKPFANNFWVGTDYLTSMGIRLVRGRDFTPADGDESARVVIINQRLAERFWPREDPVGKSIRLRPGTKDERSATIVGVVSNSKHFLMNEEPASLLYLPQLQEPTRRRFLVVRSVREPLDLVGSVRKEIWAVDPRLPITTVRSMEQVVSESLVLWTGGTAALGLLGAGALLLAALGIYGVVSYTVGQRTHEMGIRMALGASRRDVLSLVLTQGMKLAGIGLVIGLVGALALTRFLASLLYGVGAVDPLTFVGAPLVLAAIALVAAYVPARRASRADPAVVLRSE